MSKQARLQQLVKQVMPDASVTFKRGHGYYVWQAGRVVCWFSHFKRGEAWLRDWIESGRMPPLARLRIGVR